MTKEEIKESFTMRDIVSQYGLQPTRSGFISCPFHQGDRQASLKLYEKDFHCHACGANGDIFSFVQMMEDIDFKAAFQNLGGTYGKPSFSSKLAVYRSRKQRENHQKAQECLLEKKRLNHMLIHIYRSYMAKSEPLSDIWCDCYNALQYQLYIQEQLNETETGVTAWCR